MKRVLIFLILILALALSKISYADESNLYFSYKRSGDNILIGIEGYVFYENKRYNTNELNYEWTYSLNDQPFTEKTFSPLLILKTDQDMIPLTLKIFPPNMKFIKTANVVIDFSKYKEEPSVAIVKYNPDLNIILPFSKINSGEKLYALSYGFSSKNLSYEWTILDKKYYGQIFDPQNLESGTIINLVVKNNDNPQEFAQDIKILE